MSKIRIFNPFFSTTEMFAKLFMAILLVILSPLNSHAAEILLPLYSYPSHWSAATYLWDDVAAGASQVPITAIINPDSGPGNGPPNADYQVGLNTLRNAGVTMLGYVATGYGNRNSAAVKADIDIYDTQFNIDGIFLDEASSGYPNAGAAGYYEDLYTYIHGKANLDSVVINPGTQTNETFFTRPATDISVIFESNTGWPSYTADPYLSSYGENNFSALMYQVPDATTMRSYIDLAVSRNVGYLYVTDDGSDGNPWDSLPSYWQEELNYLETLNTVPVPAALPLFASGLLA